MASLRDYLREKTQKVREENEAVRMSQARQREIARGNRGRVILNKDAKRDG